MIADLLERFKAWEAIEDDPDLESGSLPLVLYLTKKLYGDYEPGGMQPFMLRLRRWLDNVDTESDQKILISLLSHVFYAGRGEFESLYRTTLTNIYRWLVQVSGADLAATNLSAILDVELASTWICPVTDSLRINSFLKINGISGHDHRPHWRSLAQFGDTSKINEYLHENSISRLILLEDFVGSGTQIEKTVDFACTNFGSLDIGLCPLIVCPDGDRRLAAMAGKHSRLSYLPTMVLPEEVLLGPVAKAKEPPTFTKGRDLISRVRGRLRTEPFGFKQTGALVVLFSNCPDNTLAIFRDEAARWDPLFPRVWRPE